MKDTAEEDPFVEEHLKHAVALENGYVTFDAKIEGRVNCSKWYKNGEEILRNPRFRVRVRRCWHRLKIRNLRKSDIGVYTLICQNDENYVTSQATLHVLPEKRLGVPRPKNCTALFLSWRKSFAITRHLKNVRIKKGDPIVLKVEICKPKNVNLVFSWYKNHRSCSPLTNDGTEIICKENKSAEYVQYNSEFQDSGIYTVVISTEGIMLSSTAEVVIMEPDCLQDKGFPAVDNPYFTQSLPDELDVFETEEVTMLCKTVLLPCNEVIFYKDGHVLEENDNVTFGYYENRGLKIHIKRASVRDCGFYSIIMRNEYSKRFAYTKCLLRVNSK
ncbi:hypothetical protein O0L34_g19416 [Tuta absoluta]|nr:hypothetical protein O0L34_g19416 [Tuta absoluta]